MCMLVRLLHRFDGVCKAVLSTTLISCITGPRLMSFNNYSVTCVAYVGHRQIEEVATVE